MRDQTAKRLCDAAVTASVMMELTLAGASRLGRRSHLPEESVAHLHAAKSRLAATPTALRGGGQVRDADERPPGPLWQALALGVQPKLAVSTPDHPAEREADRVADQVMRTGMPRPPGPATAVAAGAVALRASPYPEQASGQGRDAGDQVAAGALGFGAPMEPGLRGFFEPRFGRGFGDVRLHTDTRADAAARSLDALAFTQGSDVVFRAGHDPAQSPSGRRLLAHELAHVMQGTRPGAPSGRAGGPTVFRVAATPRPVARLTRTQIFGLFFGIGGLTLAEFQDYTVQRQADWFVEPTLAADRAFLWGMLLTLEEGPHIRSGIGDVKLANLQGVAPADWPALTAFCRATHTSTHTVRIFPPLPVLADRVALGRTLRDLEAIIPAAQLEVTVSQSQLQQLRATPALMVQLRSYWTSFQPFLEQRFSPAPGAIGPEFQRVLNFLTAIGPGGLTPLMPLQGSSPATRWVRNLHRFPLPMLNQLVTNLGETSGTRELVLILHTGHDPSAAFQDAATLFSEMVLNTGRTVGWFGGVSGPDNLVLMIEGAPSLTDMTGQIPTITTKFGKLDSSGTRRINQVVIAGHGSGHTVGMAGMMGAEESLDVVANLANTKALLDALLTHMDPATARVLFAGCLVGSRTVPAATPEAAIPAALAADQSLAAFTEARATAAGLLVTPGVTVQAARGSVGPKAVTSLKDLSGRLHPTYPADPNVFGAAPTYAQSGLEAEGVLRAAVEVAASPFPGGPVPAEAMLRTRLAMPARPTDWWDTITRLMVAQVLPTPVGSGVDLLLLNEAANVAEVPFLVRFSNFDWINAAAFVTRLNPQPFAAGVYAGLAATTAYSAPSDAHTRRLRIIVDQGRFALTGSAATLLSGILATGLNANAFKDYLDITPVVLGGHEAALMPLVGGPPVEQIRLALAWFLRDPANAHVRAFLSGQVTTGAGVPAFSPAVAAEVTAAGQGTNDVLETLGRRLTPTGPPAVGGGAPPPLANVQLPGQALMTVFVDPSPRVATVIPTALNVRTGPSMAHPPRTVVHRGDRVQVAGTAGNWSAIDIGGQLGFVFTPMITP